MTSLPLSICVVLYRSEDVTARFLMGIKRSLGSFSDYELLFYDNSPTDRMAALFAGENYIHDAANPGFSYANNRLILGARNDDILLLNPDVFGFTAEFWHHLLLRLGQDQVTFAKLLNADGSHQDCVGEPVGLTRAFGHRPRYDTLTAASRVGAGIMAFMLTTKAVFAKVGLLDCDYPLYGEDMDWSYRAGRHGVKLWYDPLLVLTHLGGASAQDRWSRTQTLTRKYRADDIFIDKHARGPRWLALRLLNRIKLAKARLK